MSIPEEIDRLYQLPLADFTAARDELLRRAPAGDKVHIQLLHKPNVPAWAVNQLYWRDRRAYDALVRAAERVRSAHAQAIKGRQVDLASAERPHAAAVKQAADRIRAILARAGDPATPSTMKAVVDTLQSLPGGGEPGRLTRPLAPLGFGALGAIVRGAKAPKLAEIVTFAPAKPPKPSAEAEAKADARARAAAAARLRTLETDARKLARAVTVARTALDRAEQARTAAERKAETAAAEAGRRRAELDRLQRDARALDDERARLKGE